MGGYRDLKVWQLGIEISLVIYKLTESFPTREQYGLSSQLRRAATSVPSNIAVGHSRGATKDLIRFLAISRGSVAELETQLIISKNLGYVNPADFDHAMSMLEEESRMLAGLRRSLASKLHKRD
jgi:four helix bundle protein